MRWVLFIYGYSLVNLTIISQDQIHLYSGEVLHASVVEVGIDSVKITYPKRKKASKKILISNTRIDYLEYENGQQYFVPRDIIELEDEVIVAKVMKIDSMEVHYLNLSQSPVKNLRLSKQKIHRISYGNGQQVAFYDKLTLLDCDVLLGQVLEINVDSVKLKDAETSKSLRLILSDIAKIEFKNGYEQEFNMFSETGSPKKNKEKKKKWWPFK